MKPLQTDHTIRLSPQRSSPPAVPTLVLFSFEFESELNFEKIRGYFFVKSVVNARTEALNYRAADTNSPISSYVNQSLNLPK